MIFLIDLVWIPDFIAEPKVRVGDEGADVAHRVQKV